jgi:uncharacterized membrane protein YedE/YeeE
VRGLDDVAYATLEWVAWFNTQRRLESLGYLTAAENEEPPRLSDSRRRGRTHITESPEKPRRFLIETKLFTMGAVIGGVIFGLGWAMTGVCPGPLYAWSAPAFTPWRWHSWRSWRFAAALAAIELR